MKKLKEHIQKLKAEGNAMRREIQRQTVGYVLAALGIVAGLAWNDAIRAAIDYFFPLSQKTLQAKFIYAFMVTAAVVIFTAYLIRLFGKNPKV